MRIKKVSQTTPAQAQIVDGYSESTTDGYSCNYVNNLNKRHIITVSKSVYQSSVADQSQVTFDQAISTGTKLTLLNNNIVIGAGVSKILASCVLSSRYNSTVNQQYGCQIRKNGQAINLQAVSIKTVASKVCSATISPSLIEVQEGDTISMYTNFGATADISADYTGLTVEVVE